MADTEFEKALAKVKGEIEGMPAKGSKKAQDPIKVTTHDAFRALVTEFGEALRQFIEDAAKQPGAAKALPIPKKDTPKAVTAHEAQASQLLGLSKGVHAVLSVPGLADDADGLRKFLVDEAGTHDAQRAKDEAAANTHVHDAQFEEASERYVEAAVSAFRGALCLYAAGDIGTPAWDSLDVINAALNCARLLTDAAVDLRLAAQNEDLPADVAEVVAEGIVGQLFAREGADLLDQVKAGMKAVPAKKGGPITFNGPSQKAYDAQKQRADRTKADADKTAGALVK